MKKYTVYINQIEEFYIDIEAKNKKQAREIAENFLDYGLDLEETGNIDLKVSLIELDK